MVEWLIATMMAGFHPSPCQMVPGVHTESTACTKTISTQIKCSNIKIYVVLSSILRRIPSYSWDFIQTFSSFALQLERIYYKT
jgi:hypothetical protein